MRQILQDLKNGETRLVEIPAPSNLAGNLLIKTNQSVVYMNLSTYDGVNRNRLSKKAVKKDRKKVVS